MSIKVTLEAGGEVLNLDEITANGEGVQAVAGLTGFGLPPVDVQWFEGAGDGAQARNVRALARDMDIPIHVFVNDPDDASARAQLRTIVAKIARVVTQTMTLKVYDDDTNPAAYKWCEVTRVGGGTYVYGADTDGVREYNTILTIRAGNPYMLYSTTQTTTTNGAPQVTASPTIVNGGTATAYPVWKVYGPCDHFATTSPDGDLLDWYGRLNRGDVLTIDTESATGVDQTGANRYEGFEVGPQMWKLKPGNNPVSFFTENGTVANRTNYSKYGSFTNGHGFTPDANTTLSTASGELTLTPKTPKGSARKPAIATTTITGLPPGEELTFRLNLRHFNEPGNSPTIVSLGDATWKTKLKSLTLVKTFVVPDSGSIVLRIEGGSRRNSKNVIEVAPIISGLFIGEAGAYFTGATAATASYTYAWTGTAGASTSTETPTPTPGNARVDVTFRPRDWQVI